MLYNIKSVAAAVRGHALVLHAAAVVRNGGTYVFVARTGGGKSTLAALCDADGLPVVGDDGVLVLEKNEAFYVRPLPRQTGAPSFSAPLGDGVRPRGAFFLVQADEPRIEPVGPLGAVARCLEDNTLFGFRHAGPAERKVMLDRLIRFFVTMPAYVLRFALDARFWDVIDGLEEKKPEPALA